MSSLPRKDTEGNELGNSVDVWWFESLTVFVVHQEQKFCQRYDQLMEAWEKKVERIENNPRRRAKESKVREYYEKQFPEIRKQREMQERMQRWDQRVVCHKLWLFDRVKGAILITLFCCLVTTVLVMTEFGFVSLLLKVSCIFLFIAVLGKEGAGWPHLQLAVSMRSLRSLMVYQNMR